MRDLFIALELVGTKRETFPAALLHHVPHGDELRVQFYDVNMGLASLDQGKESAVTINIPGGEVMPNGWVLERSLICKLHKA